MVAVAAWLNVATTAFAQAPSLNAVNADSTLTLLSAPPILRFGMDKLVNTFLFRADLNGAFTLPLGSLLVRQQYRRSTIRTSTPATRDDEDLFLRYDLPLSSNLSLLLANTAIISADTRAIGLNRLQQFTVSGGAQYRPIENLKMTAAVGGEYNEQLGIVDRGLSLNGNASLQNQRFEEYLLNADVQTAYSALANSRTNAQTNLKVGLARTFEGGGQLEFSTQYATLQREFYTFVAGTDQAGNLKQAAPSVETRTERLLRLNARATIPLFKGVDADVQGYFEDWTIGRFYRDAVDQVFFTSVRRNVDQVRFSVSGVLRATFDGSTHSLGLTIDSRDEVNAVDERFRITDADLQTLRSAEKQRDNISVRTSLVAQSTWNLFRADTLKFEFSSSLLRYDTPSPINYDDRDELFLTTNTSYTHHFSSIFSGTLFAEARLVHLVFIKAQRSAQNNWNRIFKLAPSFVYASEGFSAHPQFELLANYTSFDFEDIANASQSFSFRQIQYRDSLVWHVGRESNTTIESRFIFRYFERGEFRWGEFSELVRDRNYEAFARILVFVTPSSVSGVSAPNLSSKAVNQIRVGVGGRYYALSQRGANPALRIPGVQNQIIGPETVIECSFASGTVVRLNGWYEFQFDKGILLRQTPNLFLSATLPL